jgi:hypothetical protein
MEADHGNPETAVLGHAEASAVSGGSVVHAADALGLAAGSEGLAVAVVAFAIFARVLAVLGTRVLEQARQHPAYLAGLDFACQCLVQPVVWA